MTTGCVHGSRGGWWRRDPPGLPAPAALSLAQPVWPGDFPVLQQPAQGFAVPGSAPERCWCPGKRCVPQLGHLPPGTLGWGSVPAFWLCSEHFWEPQPGANPTAPLSFAPRRDRALPPPPKQLTHPGKKPLRDLQIEKPLRGQNSPAGAHANPGDHPHVQRFALFQIPPLRGPPPFPSRNPQPDSSGGAQGSSPPAGVWPLLGAETPLSSPPNQ